MNIDKIVNSIGVNMSGAGNLPSEFLKLEKAYLDYCESMKKSDFCNSLQRYIIENTMITSLIDLAKKFGLQDQIQTYTNKSQEVFAKLAEFGIKPL
ncbi:MAG: hypothetical protein IKL52_02160 [Candidatus Gastranaerophilales bacterium]|nr:hypothetical protein [Candidatus Gastranaerophilales bacterium]